MRCLEPFKALLMLWLDRSEFYFNFSEGSKNINFIQVRRDRQQQNQPYSSSSSQAVMKVDANKVGSSSCVCFYFLALWTNIMLPEISSH